jgi:hypothetical protein
MRRYHWTPDEIAMLSPLWRQRLILLESYEAQISRERERRQSRKGGR